MALQLFKFLEQFLKDTFLLKLTQFEKTGSIGITFISLENLINNFRGGFREGADAPPPPSGIRPPADPKGPPFDTFSEIHFWPTDPKIFLKAPSAPIYTNFERERAPKKTQFFRKIFSSAQKRLFWFFFKNLPAAHKILPK